MISIAPSILSADFSDLGREIKNAQAGGADLIHVDVMDGHFVPNITLGPPVIASIRKVTELPLDAHLMIEEPSRYVDDLVRAGVNWISVHVEADAHLNRTIRHIQDQGVRAGVALNPATPIGALEEILPELEFVLVMSVNPGFGGQHFIPSSLDKIRKLKELITSNRYRAQIEVDGGIGTKNLRELIDAGADVVVAGSAVFKPGKDPAEAVRELRSIADSYTRVLETT